MFDGDTLVVQGIHHQSFMLNQTDGKVALRDPKKKEGARKFDVPAGVPLGSVSRVIDLEMCGVFFHRPNAGAGVWPRLLRGWHTGCEVHQHCLAE